MSACLAHMNASLAVMVASFAVMVAAFELMARYLRAHGWCSWRGINVSLSDMVDVVVTMVLMARYQRVFVGHDFDVGAHGCVLVAYRCVS